MSPELEEKERDRTGGRMRKGSGEGVEARGKEREWGG